MSAGARSSVAALMEGPMNAFHVSTCCSGRRMNFMRSRMTSCSAAGTPFGIAQ